MEHNQQQHVAVGPALHFLLLLRMLLLLLMLALSVL